MRSVTLFKKWCKSTCECICVSRKTVVDLSQVFTSKCFSKLCGSRILLCCSSCVNGVLAPVSQSFSGRYAPRVASLVCNLQTTTTTQLLLCSMMWPLLWQTGWQRVAGSWTDGERSITSPQPSKFHSASLQVSLAKVSNVFSCTDFIPW